MPQSQPTINGVPGSNDNLPINTVVDLGNVNIGGELTYNWAIVFQPPGPSDVLSSTTIETPTFTPRKEGTYLIKLSVNQGLATEQDALIVAAVRQQLTTQRTPAAGETTQDDLINGWATSLNAFLVAIDSYIGDPNIVVGMNTSGGTLSRGTVCQATSSAVIKSGLPGQAFVPGFVTALSTTQTQVNGLLCVLESDTTGTLTSIANGALGRFRFLGRFAAAAFTGYAQGSLVYVNDSGALSPTQGTVLRQVGKVLQANSGNTDVWFDGVGGFEISPIGASYLVYGNPGMLTNAYRVDGDHATGATGGVPFTFQAGDTNTASLVAKRYSNLGTDIFQVRDEADDVLARFDNSGFLYALEIIAASSATNSNAITATGNGSGAGLIGNGGSNGVGVVGNGGATRAGGVFSGGATSGVGIVATTLGGNSDGAQVGGHGSGVGVLATGGTTGAGGQFIGGATSGAGLTATAYGGGDGVTATGVGSGNGITANAGANGAAVVANGGSAGTPAIIANGAGGGEGLSATGQGIGVGATIEGGGSSIAAASIQGPIALANAQLLPTVPANSGGSWNVGNAYNGSAPIQNGIYNTSLIQASGLGIAYYSSGPNTSQLSLSGGAGCNISGTTAVSGPYTVEVNLAAPINTTNSIVFCFPADSTNNFGCLWIPTIVDALTLKFQLNNSSGPVNIGSTGTNLRFFVQSD